MKIYKIDIMDYIDFGHGSRDFRAAEAYLEEDVPIRAPTVFVAAEKHQDGVSFTDAVWPDGRSARGLLETDLIHDMQDYILNQ